MKTLYIILNLWKQTTVWVLCQIIFVNYESEYYLGVQFRDGSSQADQHCGWNILPALICLNKIGSPFSYPWSGFLSVTSTQVGIARALWQRLALLKPHQWICFNPLSNNSVVIIIENNNRSIHWKHKMLIQQHINCTI